MSEIQFHERLGASYTCILLPVPRDVPQYRDDAGVRYPVQRVPAMVFDDASTPEVGVVRLDLAVGATLRLLPEAEAVKVAAPISVQSTPTDTCIRNGEWSIRIPGDSQLEAPFPGPWLGIWRGDTAWAGGARISGVSLRGAVRSEVEANGPNCIQWRTTYRWGSDGGVCFRCRWVVGSDTILVEETILEDSEGILEWMPLGSTRARAFVRGGGEGKGPMIPLAYPGYAGAVRGRGRRLLARINHVSAFNQWNQSWVGFQADDCFVGLFSACGAQWKRRGHVRINVEEDDEQGHGLRFPLRAGRRVYGIVVCNVAESRMHDKESRCILNHRKTMLSDLRLSKVSRWQLTAPAEPNRPHLVSESDLESFRARLMSDPAIPLALDAAIQAPEKKDTIETALALWQGNDEGLKSTCRHLATFARRVREVGEGGYERLIIFDGRVAKSLAYDFDLLRARQLIAPDLKADIEAVFLGLAYMFSDSDYCVYEDFWSHREPECEGIVAALKDEMGDCPVPPNFASEFFTTTGVMAELFPRHPMTHAWRCWTLAQCRAFLETYFEPDGTYRESINYHSHSFNEFLCLFYPWHVNGVMDMFNHPRVKGSFQHFVDIRTPPLSTGITSLTSAAPPLFHGTITEVRAAWDLPRRVVMPCNGNSGGEGREQDYGGQLALGALVYRDSDPRLAGQLMHLWRASGKVIVDLTHPLLTLLTLDPRIPAIPLVEESTVRQSLGLFSRAARQDGTPVWCLFRAGDCTHHMCYDQGHVHLALGDRVLLGDYGYHGHDSDGKALAAHTTACHSTILYSSDDTMGSGYTGLERAPRPELLHRGADFDWAVHRIVNTNLRPSALFYINQLPVPQTVHVRHYLFVKPDYILLWDVFEEAHDVSRFHLHPKDAVTDLGAGAFRAGNVGEPHVWFKFLEPASPRVVESRQRGPLWRFAVQNAVGAPYLTVLVPGIDDDKVTAGWDPVGRQVSMSSRRYRHVVYLPPAGSSSQLPVIVRTQG